MPQVSLTLETALLEQVQRGFVSGVYVRFDSVESKLFERMTEEQRESLSHETLPPVRMAESKTDFGALMLPTYIAEGASSKKTVVRGVGDTPLE